MSCSGDEGVSPINIKVVYGSKLFNLFVPFHSTFVKRSGPDLVYYFNKNPPVPKLYPYSEISGYVDVKNMIAQQTGLEPKRQRLLFRGQEKEDKEYLRTVGVKDNAKLLLVEVPAKNERQLEETNTVEPVSGSPSIADNSKLDSTESERKEKNLEDNESKKISKGFEQVNKIRGEIDDLAVQVATLESVIDSGTKVEEKKFIVLAELLMRQLLKLDSIEAEGDGKIQRKLEVRRVQNLVDKVDSLKMVSLNPFSNSSKSVSKTTTGEKNDFETTPSPKSSSSTKVTQDWEKFD